MGGITALFLMLIDKRKTCVVNYTGLNNGALKLLGVGVPQ